MCELCTLAALGMVAGAAGLVRKVKANQSNVTGPQIKYAGKDQSQETGHVKSDISRELLVHPTSGAHEL